MAKPFLLGIDQGTSGSRALIIDGAGTVCGYAYRPVARLHPQPDWVEQSPQAVADGVAACMAEAMAQAGCAPSEIAACGISSQRNTDFVWDAANGRPLANAITWQDLRTRALLNEVQALSLMEEARHRLGYAPGTYMSALHLAWRMRQETAVIAAARDGRLRMGQSAAWLMTALGQPAAHIMDSSLVQATGLYDFRTRGYWEAWREWVGVPQTALPAAVSTLYDFGTLTLEAVDGNTAVVPVLAMIGDQQAALFGHNCRTPGMAETTHGTASFVKLFLGEHQPAQPHINVYCAWNLGPDFTDGGQTYCLEAPTTVIGAAIRWMRDSARFLDDYADVERLATAVADTGGVLFVPAFTGLDAPYNDPNARGTILGLTLGTTRAHLVRAFLESLAFQLRAIKETIARDAGVTIEQLLVSGGVSASDVACQIQADVLQVPILRPTFTETSAWAAALLAGLGAGVWPDTAALPPLPGSHTRFEPQPRPTNLEDDFARWQAAVSLVRTWEAREIGRG